MPSGECQERRGIFPRMKTSIRIRHAAVALALAAAAPTFAIGATAEDRERDHVEARELLRRGEILPLARILDTASRNVAGDVIEVELEREDAGWEYKVKVLTPGGTVRKLYLDAKTGKVLKIKDD